MEAWQPIETAPKDGTAVLVCNATEAGGSHSYAVVMWVDDNDDNYVAERPDGVAGGWAMDDGHDLFDYRGYTRGARRDLANPTHWMPLPSPPTATA